MTSNELSMNAILYCVHFLISGDKLPAAAEFSFPEYMLPPRQSHVKTDKQIKSRFVQNTLFNSKQGEIVTWQTSNSFAASQFLCTYAL
jgi:hypothetical protein